MASAMAYFQSSSHLRPLPSRLPSSPPPARGAALPFSRSAAGAQKEAATAEDRVEALPDAEQAATLGRRRKPAPLEKGGTLAGDEAEGKDPSPAALDKSGKRLSPEKFSEKFSDPRWRNGTWDLMQFSKNGTVDWDAVIDAEVLRRKWLEERPEASSNDDPVVFETSSVPWWAWMKRFHLPEAELLNGRAAMVGFFMGYVVDSLTGVGLVDQTSSFVGKLLLFTTVLGVLFIRKTDDVKKLKRFVNEWNLYDKQWQATWQDQSSSSPDQE